ncbi:kinase [Lysobacter sp. S4-A87]|uniref:kinase n=1 Tax=Lysobacter sp. S4-A87 TaxID=2925843 RepID=UPI001F530EA6|nr:kinase [Lysobacter sp. S4-A87]UNK50749.1 kinase [Lysobacter sp. S4-A87]
MSPRLHPSASSPAVASPGFAPWLVEQVLDDALAHGSRIHAIAGLQGSGKSTLAAQVATLARGRGLRVAVLSIDDFYLGRRQRLQLGHQVHPLLATRGPPGTHDVALACATLDALREGKPVRLPRFDKLADTRLPPSRWPWAREVDLALFEGWFLKTPAQATDELREPINAVERDEDPDGGWRRYCNEALARDYPPLWSRLDRLLFLQPPGFEAVPQWRWQQEQALASQARARRAHQAPARQAMSEAALQRFVQLFERVSRQALRRLPGIAEWTLPLDARRLPLTGSGQR